MSGQVSAQQRLHELDQLQRTLMLRNAPQITDLFKKIDRDVEELTELIFPNDKDMARELVREEYACQAQ